MSAAEKDLIKEAPKPASLEGGLLRRLLGAFGNLAIECTLWTGEKVTRHRRPVAGVKIHDGGTLYGLLWDPHMHFGDAYAQGRVEVDGDLVELMAAAVYRANTGRGVRWKWLEYLRKSHRNTLAGSRQNIHRHYDLSNTFYELMLGPSMVYSCAYFPDWSSTLEEAQVSKLDHIAKKLRLTSSDTVLDIGSGWGGLALQFARKYGVKVYGFAISSEQIRYARDCARAQGLEDRVMFIEDDYRNIPKYEKMGKVDAVVSVGMLEHVGVENYRLYGDVIRSVLKDDGRVLVHAIGRDRAGETHAWIEGRIFRGCYLPWLAQMMQVFERHFSVLDVENLRPHYGPRLRYWKERCEASGDRVRALLGENFFGAWQLYLAGSIAAFDVGQVQVFQVVGDDGRKYEDSGQSSLLVSVEKCFQSREVA